MLINPPDAALQTNIVILILLVAITATIRMSKAERFFSLSITNQLKGLAILAIIFSHIGYFLSSNTMFLFPISILAGVGVNLFLFLSGFGITASSINKQLTPGQFYLKRLGKIFIPLWIVITIFYLLDFIFLKRGYDPTSIILSYFGVFRQADLYINLDSPLWYFTMILFYYLIFPWVFKTFKGKWRLITPVVMTALSYLVLQIPLPFDGGVIGLYQVHTLSFPLGMAASILLHEPKITKSLKKWLSFFTNKKFLPLIIRSLLVLALVYLFVYTALNSGVGSGAFIEQAHSVVTTLLAVLIFLISRLQTRIFSIFGKFSYEIYLLHWPILYRYDVFYKFLPAYLSTILYLAAFIILGYLLQKILKNILIWNKF